MKNKEYNPFTPGTPVPPDLFVGRTSEINEMISYLKNSVLGKQENVFLIGDRGIGKSSLTSFLKYYSETKEQMIGIHVFLGGVTSLDQMVRKIFEQILKESEGQSWFDKIRRSFGDYVKEVGLFGISLGFKPPKEKLQELTDRFPEALWDIIKNLKGEKKGLFIALDDINGLATKERFANWYKSFVDEIGTHYKQFPVFIMLIGLQERRDSLCEHQPSLSRIFRIVEIERLSDNEVRTFFNETFKKVNVKIEKDAMDKMVAYSSGLPVIMQEIGDAVFYAADDGTISNSVMLKGIITAANRIGKKYLDPKVYRTIRSPRYRSILRKLGSPISIDFTKKDIETRLTKSEKKVFPNFLKRLKDLDVIIPDIEKGRGSYRFVNEIYPIYIFLESKFLKDDDQ